MIENICQLKHRENRILIFLVVFLIIGKNREKTFVKREYLNNNEFCYFQFSFFCCNLNKYNRRDLTFY